MDDFLLKNEKRVHGCLDKSRILKGRVLEYPVPPQDSGLSSED